MERVEKCKLLDLVRKVDCLKNIIDEEKRKADENNSNFASLKKLMSVVETTSCEVEMEVSVRLFDRLRCVASFLQELLEWLGDEGMQDAVDAELSSCFSRSEGETVPESERTQLAAVGPLPGQPSSGAGDGATAVTANGTVPALMADSMMGSVNVPMLPAAYTGGAVSDAERVKYEEERANLFQQLDEKDDEIQQASQMVEQLKQQMIDQEELIKTTHVEYETLQQEMTKISHENDAAKEETSLNDAQTELQEIQETTVLHKRRTQDSLSTILKDLSEVGSILGCNLSDIKLENTGKSDKIEEEFTLGRIYISKMKTEVKAIVQKSSQLEAFKSDCNKKIEDNEKELGECRLLIQQHEARMKTLIESMHTVEKQKRTLEDSLDRLNEDCSKLKAQVNEREGQLEKVKHEILQERRNDEKIMSYLQTELLDAMKRMKEKCPEKCAICQVPFPNMRRLKLHNTFMHVKNKDEKNNKKLKRLIKN